ncbi:Wzz/FepE/Etk N-terminal domain-containing protein [Streptacidiphilus albus]|uniref:Wzz/FepE/Etk N-terminal domain-containing protein n=1 Tax=Streptacidiphilus albus TaxID=105425 RepID=UPI00068AC8E4|nr:Wzz/FepE/Etk N-terminal domain-containing protein [Streptacidiphilus albus]
MLDADRPTTAAGHDAAGRRSRLLRRWWPLLAAVPLGTLGGAGYALVAPAAYQANAYVMVVPQGGADSTAAVNFAQAYGRIIAQPEVLQSASADTGVPVTALAARIEALTSPDAPMIQISGTAPGARLSAREANAVARSLVDFGNATTRQTGVKLLSFAAAATPDAPSTPTRSLDVAVGGAAGVLIGGLGLLVRRRDLGGGTSLQGARPAPGPTPATEPAAEATEPAAEPAAGPAVGADLPQPRPLAGRDEAKAGR